MKAVDDLKYLEELLISIGNSDIKRCPRTDLRTYLLNLTVPGQLLYNCDLKLLQQFIDLYMHARHDAEPSFAANEYKEYVRLHRKLQKFLIRKHNLGAGTSNYLVRSLSESVPNAVGHVMITNRTVPSDTLESAQETCV
jgi:hypothetical protein